MANFYNNAKELKAKEDTHVFPQKGDSPEGLTKLEYFAKGAMEAMIISGELKIKSLDQVARRSIEMSQVMLSNLNEHDSSK